MNKRHRHQQQYARAVVAAGTLNLNAIAERITARLGANADELDTDVMKAHLSSLLALLERITADFEAANEGVTTDTAQDISAREDRTNTSSTLLKIISGGRARIRESLGEDALRIYGLDAPPPRDSDGLKHYTSQVITLLGDNPQKASDLFGGEFDTATVEAALEQRYQEFSAAMDTVEREKRETQAARATRDESELIFDTVLLNTANVLASHLRMAGLDVLAERIRPTFARTSGDTEVEVPELADDLADEQAGV